MIFQKQNLRNQFFCSTDLRKIAINPTSTLKCIPAADRVKKEFVT